MSLSLPTEERGGSMNVGNVSNAGQDLAQLLMMATQQQTGMAQKLIQVNAENTVKTNQMATMGQLVDTYA